ncbi:MAG: hypothetical protein UY96_C0017G0055 [Parcubacteria group bacterium GW2011_GWB1_56_8]|nr:MAG: hypothetical protein UY96_C0017G0055 [Parcubacteria group bacterium GW2011_GWB1_56_8]
MLTQSQYEMRERQEAYRREQEINGESLADRKEAQADWLNAMRETPELVATRLEWLLDGSYGRGEMMQARDIVMSPRMNRVAALSQRIALWEWLTPSSMAAAAWEKLTPAEQKTLAAKIERVIKSYEKAIKENE